MDKIKAETTEETEPFITPVKSVNSINEQVSPATTTASTPLTANPTTTATTIPPTNGQVETKVIQPRKSSLVLGNNRSRFQVAKVDFAAIPENNKDEYEYENLLNENERANGTQSPSQSYDTYDTHNVRSLRHYTREPLVRVSHYRDILSIHTHLVRPTLEDLHNPPIEMDNCKSPEQRKKSEANISSGAIKLGWIQGVFIRCLLNIWGVMLFLRLSWVVGQAGTLFGCLVILLACSVTLLTTVSMSAICTNGEVKGGGAYYMISRSLGPEFGGAIGILFSIANAVAVAMYVVGFSESLRDLLVSYSVNFIDNGINAIRLFGVITTTVLLCISLIGMQWENKTQMVLLVLLVTAMIDYLLGSFFPFQEKRGKGFVGYDFRIFKENLLPNFVEDEGKQQDFMSVFAIFFPAATGILAGANISGDLSNPSLAIPKGTFLAILVTTISYLVFAIISGSTVLRYANGLNVDYDAPLSVISNCTMASDGICKYGLLQNKQVMEMVSLVGPIIYAGIFAATLSSALASLVSAPKVFQALCKDRLFPYIQVFSKGYGKSNEPRRAYLLTYFIAIAFVLIGKLDSIAPIISNFFLAAYCLTNFSCFHATSTNAPGFRPSFKYYNKWISLFGAILCLGVMFIINWITALITFALILFLYIFIYYRAPDVNWGSSTQAEMYSRALRAMMKVNNVPDHVKTYRPQLLVLTGRPSTRPSLVDFASCLTKKVSLLICGHVETGSFSLRHRADMITRANNFFCKRKVDSFYELKEEKTFSNGAKSLMELSGLGKLKPNIILMGFKANWQECPAEEVLEYFMAIHHAFDLHLAVSILRVPEGFDFTEYANDIEELTPDKPAYIEEELNYPVNDKDVELGFPRNISSAQLSSGSSRDNSPLSTPSMPRSKEPNAQLSTGATFTFGPEEKPVTNEEENPVIGGNVDNNNSGNSVSNENDENTVRVIPKDILTNVNRYQKKYTKGTIDVWWLYDDGGLTMLVPYILSTRAQFVNCKLRVFTLANRKDELDLEKRNMAALLSKFRIDFSDVTVIPDIVKPPAEESQSEFEELISKYRENEENENEKTEKNLIINESELIALKDKNRRHMRLRELLLKYSVNASLIVMTLTVPRKGTCSAALFMAWLETLTKGMPPFLLIRGNQTSVLTFYS